MADDDLEIPEGFDEVEARVFRRGDDFLVLVDGMAFHIAVQQREDPGPPPHGFEWTGEVRPPRRGEYFWSDVRGRVVRAIKDETGVNQFGEPTGGRRILRPVDPPKASSRPALRLVKNE